MSVSVITPRTRGPVTWPRNDLQEMLNQTSRRARPRFTRGHEACPPRWTCCVPCTMARPQSPARTPGGFTGVCATGCRLGPSPGSRSKCWLSQRSQTLSGPAGPHTGWCGARVGRSGGHVPEAAATALRAPPEGPCGGAAPGSEAEGGGEGPPSCSEPMAQVPSPSVLGWKGHGCSASLCFWAT